VDSLKISNLWGGGSGSNGSNSRGVDGAGGVEAGFGNTNMRGVFLHVLADTLVLAGVCMRT
jgi:Co/Zn/Cd efflux system component